RVLRLPAGSRGGPHSNGTRHDHFRPRGVRRRGAQAVAFERGRGRAGGPTRHDDDVLGRRRSRYGPRDGTGAQRLQDRAREANALPHSGVCGAGELKTMAPLTGQPINRIDGPLKVSGKATYAYEHWDVGEPLYGFNVGATIGKGRIVQIDTTGAERSPGLRLVKTYRNAPPQGARDARLPSQYARGYP